MKTYIAIFGLAVSLDTSGTLNQQILAAGVLVTGWFVFEFINGLCTPNY